MEESRRLSPRVWASGLLGLRCFDEAGRELLLINVSGSGLGFSGESWNSEWSEKQVLNLKLAIEAQNFLLTGSVTHRSAKSFGVSLHEKNESYQNSLLAFVESTIAGAVWAAGNPRYLRIEPEQKLKWFQSGTNLEIYLVVDENTLEFLQLRIKILGNVMDWEPNKGRVFYWDQNFEFGADENEEELTAVEGPAIADYSQFQGYFQRMIKACVDLSEDERNKILQILK